MRAFYQLTDVDGANAYTIPLARRVERLTTPQKTSLISLSGGEGAFDAHSKSRAPSDVSGAEIQYALKGTSQADLQTKITAMLDAVLGNTSARGLRKLSRYEVSDGSAVRWTYARASERPQPEISYGRDLYVPVQNDFVLPDPRFYDPLTTAYLTGAGYTAETLSSTIVGEPVAPDFVFARFNITTTPFAFTIKNAGDMEGQRVIFRLASQAVNGFTNPSIANQTLSQTVSSTTDGATASTVLSINAAPGLGRARKSTDGGLTWVDDTPALSFGALQAVVMELEPGDNVFEYTDGGTPNLRLYVWWLHTYRD